MSPEEWLAQQKPAAPLSPEEWLAQQNKPEATGILASIKEAITGEQRATPETETLPEWTTMPELNQLTSVAGLKTAAGTLISNPSETVQIIQANFPGVGIRQDAKGNYILRSSVDQQEYAIPPGFSVGDIPRVAGMVVGGIPAAGAKTLLGAAAGAGATQAAFESAQAAAGGQFNPDEVAIASALGPAGLLAQRGVGGVKSMLGRPSAITPEAPPLQPEAAPEAPIMQQAEVPPVQQAEPQAVPPQAAEVPNQKQGIEVLELARKAASFGPGSSSAKAQLIERAAVDKEAAAAAERLGLEIPFDVLSDDVGIRTAVGLTRSQVASDADIAWQNTVTDFIKRADDSAKEFDAVFVEGKPSTAVVSQKVLSSVSGRRDELKKAAATLYDDVNFALPKGIPAATDNARSLAEQILSEVGEGGLKKEEKRLYQAIEDGMTYGRLIREKQAIGKALEGLDTEYSGIGAADLKRLYAALAKDQIATAAATGGEELAEKLRSANRLTAQQKGLEKRITGAYGKELDGSIATLLQSAIKSSAKGDEKLSNKLFKVLDQVPAELQKEAIATAMASVTAGRNTGKAALNETVFSPNEFVKTYSTLRANPAVFAKMVKIMGPDWERRQRDLYQLSRRIVDAQTRVLPTGKANQILGAGAVDGLMAKVISSGIAQRVVSGAVGTIPAAGLLTPDLITAMGTAKGSGIEKASKLFSDPEFQKLAIEAAATGTAKTASINRAINTKAFSDFARAIRLAPEERVQFIVNALNATRQTEEK
jgi:hypothetical protein